MKSLSLFQSDYIQLQSVVSSITSWKHSVQAVTPKKKKKKEKTSGRKKEKKTRGRMKCGRKDEKEEKKKKGMEGVCAEGREEEEGDVEKKMKKKEKEKKKRKKKKKTKNRESSTRDALPSPDVFPSEKLGNNMTPIKGRLGKNTTPTSISPTELHQNLQVDPQ